MILYTHKLNMCDMLVQPGGLGTCLVVSLYKQRHVFLLHVLMSDANSTTHMRIRLYEYMLESIFIACPIGRLSSISGNKYFEKRF